MAQESAEPDGCAAETPSADRAADAKPARSRRGAKRSAATATRFDKPKPTRYRVLCVSLYTRDIAALDALVRRMKAEGWRKANRSHLIRLALAHLDEDTIQEILDVYAESGHSHSPDDDATPEATP